ncbi:hypothetical protein DFA_07711 [Cavenderia fasciculata]|uniref:MRH domain-containing protein n=1 Tax=Cavenderia fasciculata TaxID=261658 RepID=F4Q2V7_CACFS|nr:uncharacterized protein DFA_07711 [Cavenderia fasciculata]EGG16733.1 hypothetical protein DFA_07711 [Cavenderia fasciculata]|eukprot:XP_004355207.1 hypothetical protein DFA_07711 [Cavenderia fasciculata]
MINRKRTITYLFIALLLMTNIVIGQQDPCTAIGDLDSYEAGIAWNKMVDAATGALGSAVGVVAGGAVGGAVSALAGQLAKMFDVRTDTTELLAKYIKDTIVYAIECNDLMTMQVDLKAILASFKESYFVCMEAGPNDIRVKCGDPSGERDKSAFATYFRNLYLFPLKSKFFFGVSDETKSLNVKAAALPLFVQYTNLYLGLLRDQIADVYKIGYTYEEKNYLQSLLATFATDASNHVNDIYSRYTATLNNAATLPVDEYNKVAQYVIMMALGVHDQAYYWNYLDPIKYPYGAPPRPIKTMYSPLVGKLQTYSVYQVSSANEGTVPSGMSFPNPLKANTNPCMATRMPSVGQIKVYDQHQYITITHNYVDGVTGLRFIQNVPPFTSALAGFDEVTGDTVVLAGTVVYYKPDYINSVTTYYGDYINRVSFNSSKGFVSQAIGDTKTSPSTVTTTYGDGYYLSGACVGSRYIGNVLQDGATLTSNSQAASSIIYLFSTVPIPSKPKIPVIIYKYHQALSWMSMSARLSIYRDPQSPELVGQVFGAFTYNSGDTSTSTVYQFSSKTATPGQTIYQYHIGSNPTAIDGTLFTEDGPVFNVFTTAAADRTPIYRHASTVGYFQAMSHEHYIPGFVNQGIAWYSVTSAVNTDAHTKGPEDNVFKQLKNNFYNNLCLSASATTGKPSLRSCDHTNGLQIWRFTLRPTARMLTNTLTKLHLHQSLDNTILADFSNDQSYHKFIYTASSSNQFTIKNTNSGKCLSAPSTCFFTDGNGYRYDLSPLSSAAYNVSLTSNYDTDNNNYRMFFSVCNASPPSCNDATLQSCQYSPKSGAIFATGVSSTQNLVTIGSGLGKGINLRYTQSTRTFITKFQCAATATPFTCTESPAQTYTCTISHPSACGSKDLSNEIAADLPYVTCDSTDQKQLWSVPTPTASVHTDKAIGFELGALMDYNEVFGPNTIYSSVFPNYQLNANGGVSAGLTLGQGNFKLFRSDSGMIWTSNEAVDSKLTYMATLQGDGNLCIAPIMSGAATYCTYTQNLGATMVNILQPGAYGREWGIVMTNAAGKMVWGRFGAAQSNRIALIPGSFLDTLDPNNREIKSGQFITNGRDYLSASLEVSDMTMTIYFTNRSPRSSNPFTQWRVDYRNSNYVTAALEVTTKGACIHGVNAAGSKSLGWCIDGANTNDYPTMRYLQIPPPGSHSENEGETAVVYRTATGAVVWGKFKVSGLYDNYSLYPTEKTDNFMGSSFLFASYGQLSYTLTNLKTNQVLSQSPASRQRCRKGWQSNGIFEVIYSYNINDCSYGQWDALVYGNSKPGRGNRFIMVASMPEMVLVDGVDRYLEGTSYSTL